MSLGSNKGPFEFINSINHKYQVPDKKGFSPFLTNRFFSYFRDTILLANIANKMTIRPEAQYDFWYNGVSKKKRFVQKWHKKISEDSHIDMIAERYQINKGRAKETLKLMSEGDIKELEEWNASQ